MEAGYGGDQQMTNEAQLKIIETALLSRTQAGQKQIGWKLGFGSLRRSKH